MSFSADYFARQGHSVVIITASWSEFGNWHQCFKALTARSSASNPGNRNMGRWTSHQVLYSPLSRTLGKAGTFEQFDANCLL